MKWGKKSQSPVATIRVWALASHAMRDTKQSAATIQKVVSNIDNCGRAAVMRTELLHLSIASTRHRIIGYARGISRGLGVVKGNRCRRLGAVRLDQQRRLDLA